MVPVDFAPSGPARRDVAAQPVGRRGRAPQLPRGHRPPDFGRPPARPPQRRAPPAVRLHRAAADRGSRPRCTARRRRGWSRRCPWPVSDATRPALASVSGTNAAAWSSICIDRIIGNGVDLDTWVEGAGGGSAVWTGRVVPEKAPHLAIDACRRAGMPLQLMGPVHDPAYFDAGDRAATRWRRRSTSATVRPPRWPQWSAAAPSPSSRRRGTSRSASSSPRRWPAARRLPASGEAPSAISSTTTPARWPRRRRRRAVGGVAASGHARPVDLPGPRHGPLLLTVMIDAYEQWFQELVG